MPATNVETLSNIPLLKVQQPVSSLANCFQTAVKEEGMLASGKPDCLNYLGHVAAEFKLR